MVRDHPQPEHSARLAGQRQDIIQAAVDQEQPLAQQERGEPGDRGVSGAGEAAPRRDRAARHRRCDTDET